ncbi:MAG: cell division protein ZapB [Treponema sp.]|uniref:cell division protein ZapB n=1 Tax=Treponema sp. TaxID=166 RepID=UPI0025F22D6B|nr:cell division protein ZapB [Treponema sp.]MBQ8679249.1 cell division protein ZapB [Treponema sp.]
MISFDQVLLLEEKVESAVKKIEQLNAENAALRSKCAELSNALEAKSEQFSSFESNQSKIEEGILKALSRLNAVENVVLQASATQSPSVSSQVTQIQSAPVSNSEDQIPVPEPVFSESQAVASDRKTVASQAESLMSVDESSVQSVGRSPDSLTPDVDFEFGEESPVNESSQVSQSEDSSEQSAGSSQQPMFDIF